jgi:hypothetical protein
MRADARQAKTRWVRIPLLLLLGGGCARAITAEQAQAQGICRVWFRHMSEEVVVTVERGTAYSWTIFGKDDELYYDLDDMFHSDGRPAGRWTGSHVELETPLITYVSTVPERGKVSFDNVLFATTYDHNSHCSPKQAALGAAALLMLEQMLGQVRRRAGRQRYPDRDPWPAAKRSSEGGVRCRWVAAGS